MVAASVEAEREGLVDGVWTYDHLVGSMLGRGRSHDVFAVLGAIASATERVRVGPLVANMMNRHPAQLALAMATLQSLSGGRAVLGIGAGAAPGSRFAAEHDAIGTQLLGGPDRRDRLVETIEVVRAMWSGGIHNGHHHRVDGMADLVGPEPAPAIVVGGAGARMADLALEHADGLNLRLGPGTAALLDRITTARRPGVRAGAPPGGCGRRRTRAGRGGRDGGPGRPGDGGGRIAVPAPSAGRAPSGARRLVSLRR